MLEFQVWLGNVTSNVNILVITQNVCIKKDDFNIFDCSKTT